MEVQVTSSTFTEHLASAQCELDVRVTQDADGRWVSHIPYASFNLHHHRLDPESKSMAHGPNPPAGCFRASSAVGSQSRLCLPIVYGCCHIMTARLSNGDRDVMVPKAKNIRISPFKEVC